jgi:hypothetical protein
MLTIFRRHLKRCEHRAEGRKYRRCKCPLWADGFLNGVEPAQVARLAGVGRGRKRLSGNGNQMARPRKLSEPTRNKQYRENDSVESASRKRLPRL